MKLSKINKTIGITFGDIAGIGPEVIYKALCHQSIPKNIHYRLFGSKKVFSTVEKLTQTSIPEDVNYSFDTDCIKDDSNIPNKFISSIQCQVHEQCGKLAIKWIDRAVRSALKQDIQAIVTAPINKESCYLSGFQFKGHTDYITHLANNPMTFMMFHSKKLKVLLVTHHLSLLNSLKTLSTQLITDAIKISHSILKKTGCETPQVLIGGINPHAGENGYIGKEEIDLIVPAIKHCQSKNINVKGPYPPDTLFLNYENKKETIYVCMLHDHGLIPFKLIAFQDGVNVTAGLPFPRTSPDHGTAFNIAWKNQADPESMVEAIKLAAKMSGL